MTAIAFHFNAPDKLAYACRLLRKAVGSGAKVVVTGEGAVLARLDTVLWTFSALDFVPHATDRAPREVFDQSPVVLTTQLDVLPHKQVLLNLGHVVPAGFDGFERVIEVVSLDDEDRALARQRWKQYASLGYEIERKDLVLKESA
ncbi:DNA polymerase III subunit chi [Variovorax sp. HJSM1_2]|uniref:DNA polymerase III subunit chi n=1 Tax=Variovorax sp. HJSM1_2 TaxID=3366263 RepID=UPI003BDEEDC1